VALRDLDFWLPRPDGAVKQAVGAIRDALLARLEGSPPA